MTPTLRSTLTCLAIAAALTVGATAQQRAMPAETATYSKSDLPGYPLVMRSCLTCHSAQYVATQPPTSPRAYWDATVKKMKKPFGAQFPDEDIPAIVDYLARTYGAERAAATNRATPLPQAPPRLPPPHRR